MKTLSHQTNAGKIKWEIQKKIMKKWMWKMRKREWNRWAHKYKIHQLNRGSLLMPCGRIRGAQVCMLMSTTSQWTSPPQRSPQTTGATVERHFIVFRIFSHAENENIKIFHDFPSTLKCPSTPLIMPFSSHSTFSKLHEVKNREFKEKRKSKFSWKGNEQLFEKQKQNFHFLTDFNIIMSIYLYIYLFIFNKNIIQMGRAGKGSDRVRDSKQPKESNYLQIVWL